jgi:dihydrofolate synthase/folylpolyglutamate synthase
LSERDKKMNKPKQISEWLHHLEKLDPNFIDLGLEKVEVVARALNLFPLNCFVITVGGTNGKGSCVAFLEAALSAAGYRVGSYTSPHLFHYNERVKLNGKSVSDSLLSDAFATIETARDTVPLTYFEFGTLAALLIFKQAELDVIILEVGMGGRLDAVNVVDTDLAIITTVALDHCEWLGHTREAIAHEKAGIFRDKKPAICGDFDVPDTLRETAGKLNASLYCQGKDFSYERAASTWSWKNATQQLADLPLPRLELQNISTALQALMLLPASLNISEEVLRQTLQTVTVPGRLETLQIGGIEYIFDVAHNPAAGAWLAKQLATMPHAQRTFAIVGMLADKDHAGTLTPLLDHIDVWHVASLNVPRGAASSVLENNLKQLGAVTVHTHPDPTIACQQLHSIAKPGDRIVIFGSFYTVAQARSFTNPLPLPASSKQ